MMRTVKISCSLTVKVMFPLRDNSVLFLGGTAMDEDTSQEKKYRRRSRCFCSGLLSSIPVFWLKGAVRSDKRMARWETEIRLEWPYRQGENWTRRRRRTPH